jgi:hypothetical protein
MFQWQLISSPFRMKSQVNNHFSLFRHLSKPAQGGFLSLLFVWILTTANQTFAQQTDSLYIKPDSTSTSSLPQPIQSQSTSSPDSSQRSKTKSSLGKKTIKGKIKDFTTNEPLSFATVFFPGTSTGMKSDLDGLFQFDLDKLPKDSLSFSVIGYKKKTIAIDPNSNFQSLTIELERSSIMMRDFVVKFEKDPALNLVKKAIKNKPLNDYDKAENYSYEVYNKLEMDINKIPKKAFKQSPILKQFDFVEKFIDSTSEEKPFLPLFLTETLSDYYYQKKPKKTKEFIKGSRISGYKNQSVSQMLGSMYQNINIYDNAIPIFNVPFVSPIANDAPFFYHYSITDTQWINHMRCFQVAFTPKRKGEHTFNGDFWIHDSDFAVQKINMIVTKEQNINWVNKVTMMQEFTCLEDTIWFLTKDKFYVDFLPPHGDKIAGFLGRKTTTYKNIIVNNPKNEEVINDKKNKADSQIEEDALSRNEDYWNAVRHDSLSKNEKAIYRMIDTIQGLPIYKKYYSLFYLIGTGIKEVGPLEIGSLYNLYSSNPIEGSRYRFNLGTTPKLFKNIYLRGYLAYGTLDQRFKYGASALWLLKRKPRSFLFAEIKKDVDNSVSQYDDAASIDNIFSSIGRRPNIPWKLAFVEKQRLEYMRSYHSGFRHMLSIERRNYTPYAPLPSIDIFRDASGAPATSVRSTELGLELRWAYKEQFIEGNYYVTSLGTKYPVIKFYAGLGIPNVLQGAYSYTKLRLTISDQLKIKHAGSLYYNIFAGKIFGTLPYSLLELHPGNEFYYYNQHSFNMMYRYEYLSDTYVGLITEHSLGPLFLKYVPILNKTKARFFWNAKGVYGGLTQANQTLNFGKGYPFQSLAKSPYLEVGTGIENILKVLRIDFVWRTLPARKPLESDYRRFGIFGSMKFSF